MPRKIDLFSFRKRPTPPVENDQEPTPEPAVAYVWMDDEDAESPDDSAASQCREILVYCQERGWDISLERIYVDRCENGPATRRPAFQRAVRAVRAGEARRMVVVRLDRVAQSTKDFLATVDTLDKAGCALVLIGDTFDSAAPEAQTTLNLLRSVTELESSVLQRKSKSARTRKAALAGHNGSPTAYGYDYNGKTFVPNEHASVVAGIFADYLAGKSMRKIAQLLNEAGVPTATGAKWYASTIAYILRNGLYAGLVQYDGQEVEGRHTPIVDRDTYEQVQARMESWV